MPSQGSPIRKISILIPVYNEELYVEEVLQQLTNVRLSPPLEMEIIVVDDGSTDRTSEILKRLNGGPIFVRFQERNFGKGAAIREGLKHATGDVVIIQDADLEYSTSDYPQLLEPIVSGRASVVYGSRFIGTMSGMKWQNKAFNILIRTLVNGMFGSKITDEATAYKVLRTDILRSLNLQSNRFEICPEITAKVLRRGIAIVEVPVHYQARDHSQGKKIHWTDAFSAIWTLFKYRNYR